MPKHLGGKKFSRRHTTVTDQGAKIALAAKKMPEVRSIKLGKITVVSGGEFRIKCTVINRELLKVMVRGNSSVQIIHLDTTDASRVQSKLESMFPTGK